MEILLVVEIAPNVSAPHITVEPHVTITPHVTEEPTPHVTVTPPKANSGSVFFPPLITHHQSTTSSGTLVPATQGQDGDNDNFGFDLAIFFAIVAIIIFMIFWGLKND